MCSSQAKGSLVTDMGEGGVGACVFPFTYNGTTYTECASPVEYGTVGWCAWDKDYQSDRWGYCTDACPKQGNPPFLPRLCLICEPQPLNMPGCMQPCGPGAPPAAGAAPPSG